MSWLDYYLGPTGVPDKLRAVGNALNYVNPVNAIGESMAASRRMMAPETDGWGRVEAAGDMLSGVAGVVAPGAIGARYGVPAAQGVQDAMMGFAYAPATRAAGNAFADFARAEDGAIRAYHGSPHDFDRFDLSKIGTGEGAQAYGHGLYFAENEGVARSYRDLQPASGIAATDGAGWEARAAFDAAKGDVARAIEALQRRRQIALDASAFLENGGQKNLSEIDEAIRRIQAGELQRGRMYEVDINANPGDFIDYDAPWAAQPEVVQRHFDYLTRGSRGYKPDGAELAYRMEGGIWNREAVDAGIPGIRYLDGESRGAGDGSRNYVVFDDNLVSIVRKYGIAGAATMLGISQADVAQAMEQPGMIGSMGQTDPEQNRNALRDYLGGL